MFSPFQLLVIHQLTTLVLEHSTSSNQKIDIDATDINNKDVWLFKLDEQGREVEYWTKVDSVEGNNVIYNSLSLSNRKLYSIDSLVNDKIKLVFADGVFADIPTGRFRCYYRQSAGSTYSIKSTDVQNVELNFNLVKF